MLDDDGTPDPWGEDLSESAWVRGQGYIDGWAEARDVSEDFQDLLRRLKVPDSEMQLSAGTGLDGAGVVRLKLSPRAARWLGWVLAHADPAAFSDTAMRGHDDHECARYKMVSGED